MHTPRHLDLFLAGVTSLVDLRGLLANANQIWGRFGSGVFGCGGIWSSGGLGSSWWVAASTPGMAGAAGLKK